MARVLLIIVLLGIIALGAGLVFMGAFPPAPHVHPVQKTLSLDKFKSN